MEGRIRRRYDKTGHSSDIASAIAPHIPRTATEDGVRAESEGVTVSSSTIRKRVNSAGLHGCVAAKKPLLRPANIENWLDFARRHKNWTVQQWETGLWSEESAFLLFCGAKQAIVRRRVDERYSPQCIVPTIKHGGGSLMV